MSSAKATKPNQPPPSEGGRNRHLDREIRDMVSTLTSRLSDLHKQSGEGSGPHLNSGDEDENGVRIITIAGTNTGATMRGDILDHKSSNKKQDDSSLSPDDDDDDDNDDGLDTFVNSNFQAVNNSIMFGATYTSNDPGVHMDVADKHGRSSSSSSSSSKVEKNGKRGSRKGKEVAQGNQQQQPQQAEFTE